MAEEDLRAGRWTIPGSELSWDFGTSGGPGGQHANKANTRAELSWAVGETEALPADVRRRVMEQLSGRLTDGILTVGADDSRSQWRNRSIARKRLAAMVADAARPAKRRKPTRPTRASKRRRLAAKRHRSEVKRLRGPIDPG